MTKTFFDFSEMIVSCLHEQGFTNTVKQDQLKVILAELMQITQFFSSNDFEEAAEELDNCHKVQTVYLKTRLGELLSWRKKDIDDLKRKKIWQIPLSEEARLFGVLEKAKYWGATNIFQALIFDPNHKIYRPSSKEPFPIIKNSVCLFSEEEECEKVRERKKVAKK